jgi:DNA-binding transcriptional MerR regulator
MRRRTTTRVIVEQERGVFMISVAAELAEMHPQTLRMYETRGLIEPKRSPKGTRLYSQADVERLRRIQAMTTELGLNLAGVERVLELEEQLERASRRLEALERHYAWIDPAGLEYFRTRLVKAPRDAQYALELTVERCRTCEQQDAAVAALRFKTEMLWAQLDAIERGDTQPPGADA